MPAVAKHEALPAGRGERWSGANADDDEMRSSPSRSLARDLELPCDWTVPCSTASHAIASHRPDHVAPVPPSPSSSPPHILLTPPARPRGRPPVQGQAHPPALSPAAHRPPRNPHLDPRRPLPRRLPRRRLVPRPRLARTPTRPHQGRTTSRRTVLVNLLARQQGRTRRPTRRRARRLGPSAGHLQRDGPCALAFLPLSCRLVCTH